MNVKVLLWYDTEDYITPESDDALLALMDMMNARGVRATFKIVGEKARVLKERGWTDILEKLKGHEVGYHTDFHSMHPTVSEYLESAGFREGAAEFEKRETSGLKDVAEITGQYPSCYGQPGGAWAPQVYPVLRKWNIPVYLDSHNVIDVDKKPFWYGGIANFNNIYGIMRMNLSGNGLEKAKKDFDRVVEGIPAEKTALVSIYYHPCEFATTQFWDGCNFPRGNNPPRDKWISSPLRPAGEMELYIDMLGKFIDYILSKGNTEFITASQILKNEIEGGNMLSMADVKAIASSVGKEMYFTVHNGRSLSASELFSLFCNYLSGKKLSPKLIYGPEKHIDSDCTGRLKVADIKNAVSVKYPEIFGFKQLPDYFSVEGKHVNPVDMACTLARIIREDLDDDDYVEVVGGMLKSSIHINENDSWGDMWVIFPEDLKVPNIIKMAKLQAWTLKPALF
jgi:hypothetical protein